MKIKDTKSKLFRWCVLKLTPAPGISGIASNIGAKIVQFDLRKQNYIKLT